MVRRLRGEPARLEQFPESGRMVPEYGNRYIRELIVGSYRIVYRLLPDPDRVQVVMVVHGSRPLPPLDDWL
jgi:toxin ParE1/3/4